MLTVFLERTRFSASVVDLLAGESRETEILRELATGSPGRLLTLRLFAETGGINPAAEIAFIESLRQSASVAKTWKSGQDGLTDAGNLLFTDRYVWLLPDWIEENMGGPISDNPPDSSLLAERIVTNLVDYLDSPDGMALVDLVPRDPFLLMGRLERLFPSIGVEEDRNNSVFWIEQTGSPFNETAQEALFEALVEALAVARVQQPELQMEYTGVAVFASASKEGIKAEIERLNLLGIGLVLLIALYAVRNIAALLRIGLVVAMALLVAATAVVTVFETVHVIALVIGSILTGIAVDYGFHLLLREEDCLGAAETRKVVIAGSLSSALGFLVLTGAPLPFLRQVGVFVGCGLLAAMAAALLLGSAARPEISLRVFKIRPGSLPPWSGILPLVVALPGLFMLSWSSNIQDLEYPLPGLKETDARLRSMASPLHAMPAYLLHGEDILNCRDQLQAIDPHGSMTHAGKVLPTAGKVLVTQQKLRQMQGFREAFSRELDRAGFYPEAFDEFLSDWESYLQLPLSENLYREKMLAFSNALPGPLQNFIHIGEDVSWIMVLSPDPIDRDLHPDLIRLDQADMLSREFARYGRTMWLFAAFCLAVLTISVCVYFGFLPGLEAIAVPFLASAVTFGIIGLWQGEFGLFHLVGGTLAFCISLDYGLFAATSRRTRRALPKSITVSSVTTIAVFGVLASSHVPGVHHLAITVLIVMVCTLLLILIRWPMAVAGTDSLFKRIPHGKDALMVESIRSIQPDQIVAVCNPHQFQPVPSECLVEAMAQCAALLLAGGEPDMAPRSGMLVVVQACEIHSATIHPGQSVVATVRRLSEAQEGLVQFAGECSDRDNNSLTASRFSIFIPPANQLT